MDLSQRRRALLAAALSPMALAALPAAAQTTQPTNGKELVGTFQGHTYDILFDNASSWTQAEAVAKQRGGTLAAVTSAAEDQFIDGLLSNGNAPTGSFWIGAFRSGTLNSNSGSTGTAASNGQGGVGTGSPFVWATGEPFSYTHWAPGTPDNFNGMEDRGSILWTNRQSESTFSRRGNWNDLPDTGYPAGFGQPDLQRAGFVIEANTATGGGTGGTSGGGGAVPLPAAVLMFIPGAGLAAFSARRMRRR